MTFGPHVRKKLLGILGEDLMHLLDLCCAVSPYAPSQPTKAEKHAANAAAWRSASQSRRAGYSNAKQAQKREEARIRKDHPDFDPFA